MKQFFLVFLLCILGCTTQKKQPLPHFRFPFVISLFQSEYPQCEDMVTPESEWLYAYQLAKYCEEQGNIHEKNAETFILSLLKGESFEEHQIPERFQQILDQNEFHMLQLEKDMYPKVQETWESAYRASHYYLYCSVLVAHLRTQWNSNIDIKANADLFQKIQEVPLMAELEKKRNKLDQMENIYLQLVVCNNIEIPIYK